LRGNPQLTQVHSVLGTGGFELPADQWTSVLGDKFQTVQVTHGENTVQAYLFPALHISTINSHLVWRLWIESEGRYEYSAKYQPGFKSRLQIFCLIKELLPFHPDTVIISVGGMNCKAWWNITKLHRQNIIKTAGQIGKKDRYPRFSFWMPVQAGERELVGSSKKSHITPPVPAWNHEALESGDDAIKAKMVSELYVGADTDGYIVSEFWKAGVEWKAEQEGRNKQALEMQEPTQPKPVAQVQQPQQTTVTPPQPETPPDPHWEDAEIPF
jgi:hypothetical protein